ncbi:septal ring lytic transglycosylase RlpA family protein [Vibrio methylphosphonaticus]|uniref:septal ring lytic transglycosylase RlpA family protein n=1 Tax=Vibrio methylphosphonaticus TaxID=2946866 RepID=UPI00202A5923|nr:septal ring lytic transglycosylase RlpA family protein [Vibrio methylphosphonaticus]MCL9773252.1 septal ring lytic transglycosylase RlpA family protein [Vibrio methylphosphonaticus]
MTLFSTSSQSRWLLTCLSIIVIAGCSSSDSRYDIDNDVAPTAPISVDHIEGAQPKYEPYSMGGNKDYKLRGQRYSIVKDAQGFTEKGQASWYGKKFHGHLTSNGEVYDMYSMSAAHKTLPIPSYVKVTNTDNGKETIVRVNDRGPFHEGRIIDLSYAAAKKLDVIKTGTANVQIEVITVDKPTGKHQLDKHPKYGIQVVASPHKDRITKLSNELSNTLSVETFLSPVKNNYRLMLGPFSDYKDTHETLEQVQKLGYTSAFVKKL